MTWLTISDIGGRNPRTIKSNGADRSWSVNDGGTLSAEVVTADLIANDLTRPKGAWITVEDTDLGTWSGQISDSNAHADGTTEIAAQEWKVAAFAKRLMPKRVRGLYGPAGSLALMGIAATEQQQHLWVADRTAEDGGVPVQAQMDGQELLDYLDSLRSASGQEYAVDHDTMAFHWGPVGRDRTNSVQLVAPRHIVDFSVPDSLDPLVNWLKVTTDRDDVPVPQSVAAVNVASIQQFGIRQGTATVDRTTAASALKRTAQAMVDGLAQQGATIECRIVNRDQDDRCWSWFREGDTLCMLIPQISSQLDVRIMARSISDSDRVLSVSGVIRDWQVG
jgi:hypothetical protein